MRRLLPIFLTGTFLLSTAVAQQDFTKVEIRAKPLAGNLQVLFGAGGNMALLTGADGAVLVDDQFAPLAPKIRAAIALLTDQPVRFVINTHWHFDHTGGNEAFGASGSVIVAHQNTRQRMSTRQVVDFFKVTTPPSPAAALPIVTFAESVSLHLNGEDIDAVHVANAHSDSDVVLFFRQANVVHAGDTFVNGPYPFIDMGSGGSIDGLIAAVKVMLARCDEKSQIIPGHGPMANKIDLQAYHDMLLTVRDRVKALLARGRTQEQVLAARPTAEFDARYGAGAMRPDIWLQRVYADLLAKQARRK